MAWIAMDAGEDPLHVLHVQQPIGEGVHRMGGPALPSHSGEQPKAEFAPPLGGFGHCHADLAEDYLGAAELEDGQVQGQTGISPLGFGGDPGCGRISIGIGGYRAEPGYVRFGPGRGQKLPVLGGSPPGAQRDRPARQRRPWQWERLVGRSFFGGAVCVGVYGVILADRREPRGPPRPASR